MLFITGLFCWNTFSTDYFLNCTDASCASSSFSNPFFTFVINFIASKSGLVEECLSSTGQWGFSAESVGKCETSWALGTFGKIVESIASFRIWKTLAVFFVLTSWTILLNALSVIEGVSSVAGFTCSNEGIIKDTWESGKVSLEYTSSVDAGCIRVISNEGAGEDIGEVIKSVRVGWRSCPYYTSKSWRIDGNPWVISWNGKGPSDCLGSYIICGISTTIFGKCSKESSWCFTQDFDWCAHIIDCLLYRIGVRKSNFQDGLNCKIYFV